MDKEKQIEILLLTEAIYKSGHGLDWEDCKDIAEQLDFLDYRKIPKNAIIQIPKKLELMGKEYDLQVVYMARSTYDAVLKQAHKQAIREVLDELKKVWGIRAKGYNTLLDNKVQAVLDLIIDDINELEKRFGVEL